MAQRGVRIAGGAVTIGLLLLLLGSCTAPAGAPPAVQTEAASTPPPPAPAAPPKQRDSCGALPLQYLVGKPRTEIPVPVNPSLRRVVCSTCMITEDYNPGRQTITYDDKTGLVLSVRCG